ncbi:MAG: cyclic lactone autoinducer peptide [Eubacteriaceae bacterium]
MKRPNPLLSIKKHAIHLLGALIVLVAVASAAFPCIWLFGQPKVPEELLD